MKKIIIFLIFTLCFLTGCGNNLEKKVSLNGLLEYNLIKDWEDMPSTVSTLAEIAVQKSDNSIGLMAEYSEYAKDKPEDFIEFQENTFKQLGGIFEEEFSLDEKGRKLYGKIYNASEEDSKNKFVAGVFEIEKNKDAYISFVATLISAEDAINQIKDFLITINFTGKTLNEKRHIVPEKEYFEFDLPKEYRRTSRMQETNFIKPLEDGVLYANLKTLSKENLSVEEQFESLDKGFNNMFGENEVYKEDNTEKIGDLEIRSKIYKYSLNGSNAYSYFGVINFTKTNLMVAYIYDILTNGDFEPIEKEIENLTKSVKLKKNAEKLLKKDIEEFKKEIEENQKEMEKELEEERKKQEQEEENENSTENLEETEKAQEIEEPTTDEIQENSEKE